MAKADDTAVDVDKRAARKSKRTTGTFEWDGDTYEIRDEPTGGFMEAFEQGRSVAAVRAQLGPEQAVQIGLTEMGASEIQELIAMFGSEVWGVKNR